ncbi:MAG: hypothetical protein RLO52_34105 [Sandaracinaceae bacterium]
MELAEAFTALASQARGSTANAAAEAIQGATLRFARMDRRCTPDLAQDCAQDVLTKLLTRFATGENPVERPGSGACAGYLRSMVANWLNDRSRETRRVQERRAQLSAEPTLIAPAEAIQDGELLEDLVWLRALLSKVADRAIADRHARHRHHLERGWRELEALVFDEVPLRDLLEVTERADAAQIRAARDAAYKRHERTRSGLAEAVGAMEREGLLTAEETTAARTAVAGLARRRRSNREDS